MHIPSPRLRAAVTAVALLAALTACSGSSSSASAPPSAATLLAQARTTLDATSGVHFVLSSLDVPAGVTALTAGEGDAVHPDKFKGTLTVTLLGTTAQVAVVSTGGVVYAKLPFTAGFIKTDPHSFGINDPGTLISPDSGITQLLSAATDAKLGGEARVGTSVVREVTASLPGTVVAKVLTSKDPTKPVLATFSIDEKTSQLRQAKLIGPFFAATNSTYTLVLDRYGEQVDISAPTAS